MTSKERAEKRAQANNMEPLFQLGKGGMSDALIKQVDDALTARELIKVKVLRDTSPLTPREAANRIAEATGSEVVAGIGGGMRFFSFKKKYRYSKKLHENKKKKK